MKREKDIALPRSARILRARKPTRSMAELANKYPENITGTFYVDDQCIDCDLCRETAPASFRRDDNLGLTIVFHQPETPEELAHAREALQGCPTDTIGDDGV